MTGIGLVLAVAACGVDYGWQPGTDGQLEYVIQIEPVTLIAMREGQEIVSQIDPFVKNVRRFHIRVGTELVPRLGNPPQAPMLNSGNSAMPPPGVAYGWQMLDAERAEFIVQVAPERLITLRSGEPVRGEIPWQAGQVNQVRIISGTRALPQQGRSEPQASVAGAAANFSVPANETMRNSPADAAWTLNTAAAQPGVQQPSVRQPAQSAPGAPTFSPASNPTDLRAPPSYSPPAEPPRTSQATAPAAMPPTRSDSRSVYGQPAQAMPPAQYAPVQTPLAAPATGNSSASLPQWTTNANSTPNLTATPYTGTPSAPASVNGWSSPLPYSGIPAFSAGSPTPAPPASPPLQQRVDANGWVTSPYPTFSADNAPASRSLPMWSGEDRRGGFAAQPETTRRDLGSVPSLASGGWGDLVHITSLSPAPRKRPAPLDFWDELARTAEDPQLAYLRDDGTDGDKPWWPLSMAVLALFASLGANLYLGWIAVGIYRRYLEVAEDEEDDSSDDRDREEEDEEAWTERRRRRARVGADA